VWLRGGAGAIRPSLNSHLTTYSAARRPPSATRVVPLTKLASGEATKQMTAERAHTIINGYTLAFFERYLRGKDVALPSFPEATESWSRK